MPLKPFLDAVPARGPLGQALRIFNIYQIVVSCLLLALKLGVQVHGLGELNPQLYLWTVTTHLLLALACALWCKLDRPGLAASATLLVSLGLIEILLLMHSSGGIVSGVGVLMIPCVAAAGLLLQGRLALLFAAFGALTLLLDQVYAQIYDLYETTAYTQIGLLGAALFATALAANTLSRRSLENEALAERRGRQLEEMSILNEYIVERMPSGIVVVDSEEQVRLINQEAARLLGQTSGPRMLPLGKLSAPLQRNYHRWLRSAPSSSSKTVVLPDGRSIEVRFSFIGDETHPVTLLQIDDAGELNRRIEASKLSSLGRLSASIAHEIRNPLAAISHAAQLLAESSGLPSSERRMVDIIHDQAKRMNTVIANVLGIYRREPASPELLGLAPWLEEFLEEFARQRGLLAHAVTLEMSPPHIQVRMDPSHLRQILSNLLGNAVQHGTVNGRLPHISLSGAVGPASGGPAYLDVIDDGPGIPPAEHARLFEPLHGTTGGGTGLGLYIAQELCAANGARLSYLPPPSGGSCFRIEFPRVGSA